MNKLCILIVSVTLLHAADTFDTTIQNGDPRQGLIANSTSLRFLASEKVALLPLQPQHASTFHSTYSDPQQMSKIGKGIIYQESEVNQQFVNRFRENLLNHPTFTWAIIIATPNGPSLAGRIGTTFNEAEKRMELMGLLILQQFQGYSLVLRASNLVVASFDEDAPWCATVHPENIGSQKTLERIQAHGRFVLKPDVTRQNVSSQYGVNQSRNWYLSQYPVSFNWYSFYQNRTITYLLSQSGS